MQSHDAEVAGWLARHHHVITRERALALGLSPDRIDGLVRRREWVPWARGVYVAACSPRTQEQAALAAVAAGGRGSAASHLSAAWLQGLADRPPAALWVTVPHETRTTIPGAVVRRSRHLPISRARGVPVTMLTRTLIDCAAVVDDRALGLLVDRAVLNRRLAVPNLLAALSPTVRLRGARALRAHLVARGFDGGPAPSVLESHFARCITDAGLPPPRREYALDLEGRTVVLDTAYPELMLAFEVDGHAYHSNPEQVRGDHRRRSLLARHRWEVHVFTWSDVVHRRDRVVADLRAIYAAAAVAASQAGT